MTTNNGTSNNNDSDYSSSNRSRGDHPAGTTPGWSPLDTRAPRTRSSNVSQTTNGQGGQSLSYPVRPSNNDQRNRSLQREGNFLGQTSAAIAGASYRTRVNQGSNGGDGVAVARLPWRRGRSFISDARKDIEYNIIERARTAQGTANDTAADRSTSSANSSARRAPPHQADLHRDW